MLRLQDLVDKLQAKVKSYKRQAEEAVSERSPRAAPPASAPELWRGAHRSSLPRLLGFRMNKPMLISPSSEKLSMSSRRLKNGLISPNLRSISFAQRPETSPPAGYVVPGAGRWCCGRCGSWGGTCWEEDISEMEGTEVSLRLRKGKDLLKATQLRKSQ